MSHPAKRSAHPHHLSPNNVGPSGLHRPQRQVAREIAVRAAMLGYHHRSQIHYTQGSLRWQGIDRHLVAAHGHFPDYADCSAYVSWCLWNALHVRFGLKDVVNSDGWAGGFTGTLAQNGHRVIHVPSHVMRGDAVLYGLAPTFEHTAIVVGHTHDGTPLVISHGSEAGPLLLPFNYRPDHNEIRRYI